MLQKIPPPHTESTTSGQVSHHIHRIKIYPVKFQLIFERRKNKIVKKVFTLNIFLVEKLNWCKSKKTQLVIYSQNLYYLQNSYKKKCKMIYILNVLLVSLFYRLWKTNWITFGDSGQKSTFLKASHLKTCFLKLFGIYCS